MKPSLTLLALLFSARAWAGGVAENVVVVDPQVWLPPPASRLTAAYMRLKNNGAREARLVAAKAPTAHAIELHNHINDKGIMRMRQVSAIVVPAHAEVALEPGGYHLMLIGLAVPLKEGERIAMTLVFDDGSHKEVAALVKKSLIGMSVQ